MEPEICIHGCCGFPCINCGEEVYYDYFYHEYRHSETGDYFCDDEKHTAWPKKE